MYKKPLASPIPAPGKYEVANKKRNRRTGHVCREVTIFGGEMLNNVERIRDTLTAAGVPHLTASNKAITAWGYSDTMTALAEYGARMMLQDPNYLRIEVEAARQRNRASKTMETLDSIMGQDHGHD